VSYSPMLGSDRRMLQALKGKEIEKRVTFED
jgi:hypothetical protein